MRVSLFPTPGRHSLQSSPGLLIDGLAAVLGAVERSGRLPTVRRLLAGAFLALAVTLAPRGAAGQWPGEVHGRVLDALTGAAVPGVAVGGAGRPARTDATGGFRLRSIEPGSHLLTLRHPGYATARVEVEVRPGHVSDVQVLLEPVPLEVEGVEVRAARGVPEGAVVIESDRQGASSVAELLERVPGAVVTGRGPSGARTLSIRGSGADEVLVLVDGVPLNDPVTGVADLSLLSAAGVRRVIVVPGARSARYGSGAQGGVVLVETGGTQGGTVLRGRVGSLDRGVLEMEVGGRGGSAGWSLGASHERIGGTFAFRRPAEVGGGRGTRDNGDLTRSTLNARLETGLAGGGLDIRLRGDAVERGLPGRLYAPSPRARQEDQGAQVALAWRAARDAPPVRVDVYTAFRRTGARDPAPPAGLPWGQRSTAHAAGAKGRLDPVGVGSLRVGGEVEWSVLGIDSDALEEGAPRLRHTLSTRMLVREVVPPRLPFDLSVAVGMDRARRGVHVSHELALRFLPRGGFSAHAAHRSAYTPPSLADQYFRAGVGVEPNPDLRGERIPSEMELGVAWAGRAGASRLTLSVTAFAGDTRDMIVWLPDYRFVWSPRNEDVARRGVEARADAALEVAGGRMAFDGAWSRTRVVWADRPDVQVVYRPRQTARLGASWRSGLLHIGVAARYTGRRNPVPSPVNELPGFWTVDARVGGLFVAAGWSFGPRLEVERLLDSTATMIFGFPEPGRRISVGVEARAPEGSR